MTIWAEHGYRLERIKQQEYERGWRAGYDAAHAEMARAEKLAVMDEQLRPIPKLEDRIRRLESAEAKMIGAVAAISGLVGVIATLIATHH
jgi:flagellar biosynthesis/type III secretory pathway protein FliH